MSGGDAVLYYASKGRLRRRLRASTNIASKYNARYNAAVVAAGGGAGTNLTRTTSGVIFFDDFVRSDRALNGDNGWVTDTGTWAIVSNVATNTSAGNFDRNRNTGVSATTAMYEHRVKTPGVFYGGIRFLAPSSSDDWHQWIVGNNSDQRLAYGANSDNTVATIGALGGDTTNFHVVKVWYAATRNFVVWHNHVLKLGTIASPFTPAAVGPTAAANVGFMTYGGAVLFDWVLVSSSYLITVTGLTGTQAFRLFASGGATIGSSAAQTAGSATLDISGLVDGLTVGYVELHTTTSFASLVARYPSAGDATDLCGGDVLTLT